VAYFKVLSSNSPESKTYVMITDRLAEIRNWYCTFISDTRYR